MGEIRATFVFDGRQHEVAAISSAGLLVQCVAGFAEETVRRMRGGSFAFVLRDPATGNEIELAGELVRFERADAGGPVVRIWVAKHDKKFSRPDRADSGSAHGERPQFASFPQQGRGAGSGKSRKIIALGGGKGGVGKTIVAVNLALALARLRNNVTLLDGDAGNCNCNTLLGITRVENSLEEYLRRERSLDEVTVATAYARLRLVCGAQNKVDALLAAEMSRLLTDIGQVQADCVVIDLGAGMSDATLDLYRLADEKIIVVTPQVTSLQNAYSFIKSAFFHDLQRTGGFAALLDQAGADPQKLHTYIGALEAGQESRQAFAVVLARQRFTIVGNMVNDDQDMKIVQNLQKVVGQYLHIENQVLGTLAASEDIRSSINRITPFVALAPDLLPSRQIKQMALRLTRQPEGLFRSDG